MNDKELSIIIPVYNGQDYIVRCVDSIMRQRDADQHEIIIVDDGSTDDTPKILDAAANVYKNIRVIHQKNGGVSVARNTGIAASHGKYVTFVDADDMVGLRVEAFDEFFYEKEKVFDGLCYDRRLTGITYRDTDVFPRNLLDGDFFTATYFINMLNSARNTGADVVLGGHIAIEYPMSMWKQVYETETIYGKSTEDKDKIILHAETRQNANFALYSRKMLDVHNLRFMVNMDLDEDILFCMLAALYAEKVVTVPDVTYFYYRHENTLSNITNKDRREQKLYVAYIQRFSVFLSKLSEEIVKQPDYARIFHWYMKMFAQKYDPGKLRDCFPPEKCFYCGEKECTGCFVADGMREQFTKNIEKYLGTTK